jgi:hypothetical protein
VGSFGGSGSGAGQLNLRATGVNVGGSGVAVNEATGDVYVADTENRRVDEFEAGGTFVRAWGWGVDKENPKPELQSCTTATGCLPGLSGPGAGEFEAPVFVAVDNSGGESEGDVYVGDSGNNVVSKFTPEGELMKLWGMDGQLNGSSTTPFAPLAGVAVGGAGGLEVTSTIPEIFHFEQNGTFLSEYEANEPVEPRGLTDDAPAGGFFLIDDFLGSHRVKEIEANGQNVGEPKVNGAPIVSADGLASDATALFVAEPGLVRLFDLSGEGQAVEPEVEVFGEGTLSASAGVAVNESREDTVFVSDSGSDVVDEFGPGRVSAPAVLSESVSEVTDDSAVFDATIDPRSLPGEQATEYHFAYGPCPAVGSCESAGYPDTTAPASLAAAFEEDTVALPEPVQGLQPDTVYHYRVVASNGQPGVTEGPERIFRTPGTGGFVLPDARRWQLVSPSEKRGALIEPIGGAGGDQEASVQAAADGHAITYVAGSPTEANPAGSDNYVQILSAHGTSGWSSRDLTVPHAELTTLSVAGQEYRGFSEDLSVAAVQPWGTFVPCTNAAGEPQPCISPAASEQTAFLENTTSGAFTPLETGCPATGPCPKAVEEFANVPKGSVLGGSPETCRPQKGGCGPHYVGATPDFKHVLLGELQEWTAGAPPAEQLRQVSVLPPNAQDQALDVAGKLGNGATREGGVNTRNAVSTDGSRVIWEADGGEEHRLFMRVNATMPPSPISEGKCTVPADACTVAIGVGEYQTANTTASRVFYSNGGELYEFDVEAPEGERVTQIAGGFIGAVIGTSRDGSYVYFVSNAQLAPGAPAGGCESGTVAQQAQSTCNLYLYHDATTSLVAVLSGNDKPDWGYAGDLEDLTGRVSPDGGWLSFMSQRQLTGYDNSDASSGRPDEEVYLYHASENLAKEQGNLVCASCDPTGARPHGTEYGIDGNGANPGLPLAGGDRVWPGTTWIAANVPGWSPTPGQAHADYQSRYLSDTGRLFFNSHGPLVAKDTNGTGDVYEYEPAGVPSGEHACSPAAGSGSEVYKPGGEPVSGVVEPAGCVALISSGTGARESAFLDASETGSDVFFLTGAPLVKQDVDSNLDVYDAHECTSESPCLAEPGEGPPPCDTEASCKAAPTPQPEIFGPTGSATFTGPGNLAPPAVVPPKKVVKKTVKCKKNFVKNKKNKCVKRSKTKKRAEKSAHTNRRAQ